MLPTQEAEIRRIMVQSQQIEPETQSQNPSQNWASRVAESIGSEFKLQHCKNLKIDKN
jgi:hypothetical protein